MKYRSKRYRNGRTLRNTGIIYSMINQNDKPLVYSKRIKNQADNKMKDFLFKLLHKILPNQENLIQWKISTSNKCRFGCNTIEDQCHQFKECSRLCHLLHFVETIFASLQFNIKMTYKTLLFGHRIKYSAYNRVNNIISQIFYSIYKYWLKNDSVICIK